MTSMPSRLKHVLTTGRVGRAVAAATDAAIGAPPVRTVLAGPFVPARRHRVSVIMPSYGYARFLPGSIASITGQQGVDVELIVVDDCGPDDSLDVARRESARYPEGMVRVVQNERNLGPAETFNVGRRHTTGEFVLRCDADDELAPGALARAVAVMERCPEVSLVYGAPDMYETPTHDPAPEPRDVRAVVYRGLDWARHVIAEDRNLIGTPEAMLRATVFDDVGEWTGDNRHGQDFEAWLRASTAGDVAHLEGCVQAFKRNHENNLSATAGFVGTSNYVAHRMAYDALFERVGDRFPDADAERERARGALANRIAGDLIHAYTRGEPDPATTPELEAMARELGASPSLLAVLDRAQRLGSAAHRDPRLLARAATRALARELRVIRWEARGL